MYKFAMPLSPLSKPPHLITFPPFRPCLTRFLPMHITIPISHSFIPYSSLVHVVHACDFLAFLPKPPSKSQISHLLALLLSSLIPPVILYAFLSIFFLDVCRTTHHTQHTHHQAHDLRFFSVPNVISLELVCAADFPRF